MLDDLSRAREGFVLASDLHLVYLSTPINVEVEPDWELYYERFLELSALDQVILLLSLEPIRSRLQYATLIVFSWQALTFFFKNRFLNSKHLNFNIT